MSRYKQSRKATNKDDMYKDVFDKKGVKNITQFRARRLRQVDEKVKQRVAFKEYIWSYGDTFWLLASKNYSDSKLWWVIASFNNKPTEAHMEIGETIRIPTNLSEVLRII
jgi:nucleoid-associated protein YgaU